jgi:hypothetical protein
VKVGGFINLPSFLFQKRMEIGVLFSKKVNKETYGGISSSDDGN